MLATVDLNNETRTVTGEIDDKLLDANLPPEMRVDRRKAMTQVPPKFSLSLRWRRTHLPCETTLR